MPNGVHYNQVSTKHIEMIFGFGFRLGKNIIVSDRSAVVDDLRGLDDNQ